VNRLVHIGIGLAAAGIFAGAAQAHGVSWSLSVGVPGFGFYAPPVVVAPAPYYYAPPPRVYYAPPPRVYYAPAHVAPAPVWVAPRHRPHRHWNRGGRGHRYYGGR